LEICREIGFKCEKVEDKKYPRTWYRSKGYIIVYFDGKKSELLKMIYRKLSEKAKF
jgi:signal recognition particle subunit SEC65